MAVSKRLRFEVLRRDGFACRYCGVKPEDGLVIDHVIPEALGGKTDASNLVAACFDCNSGKASTHPDEDVIRDVEHAAEEWRAAMQLAAEELDGRTLERMAAVKAVDAAWSEWNTGGRPVPRPRDWSRSVEHFLTAGLTAPKLEELVLVAMNSRADAAGTWRYFCGCAWTAIRQLQDRAAEILADAPHSDLPEYDDVDDGLDSHFGSWVD